MHMIMVSYLTITIHEWYPEVVKEISMKKHRLVI